MDNMNKLIFDGHKLAWHKDRVGAYSNGQKVADKEMTQLQLKKHDTFPNWNHTLSPTKNVKRYQLFIVEH